MQAYKDLLKYASILGIAAALSAFILACVYQVTKIPIAEALRYDFLKGLEVVLPPFNNAPDQEFITQDEQRVYIARMDGKIVGYASEGISRNGYSGDIKVLVGVKPDGTIYGVKVLSHTETPGLGDRITSPDFLAGFAGAPMTDTFAVRADGGKIDQFSGATVSPRAVAEAVNHALAIQRELMEGVK